ELDQQLVDALVEAASESWQRVAEVEEQSVSEVQGATERIAACVARAEADGDDVQSRRETVGQLVDALTARARDFGQRMAEVEQQSIEELRRAAARIGEYAAHPDARRDDEHGCRESIEEVHEHEARAQDPVAELEDDGNRWVDGTTVTEPAAD